MQWWHHQRTLIPNVAPDDWTPPVPRGRAAWPKSWTEEHAGHLLSMPESELRTHLITLCTKSIHNEVLRDGYDLREVDYEGNPRTEYPERAAIESFVLHEQTLRDRVLETVVEVQLGIPVPSTERKEIRSVETLVRFATAFLDTCREPPKTHEVPDAVCEFLAAQTLQPTFGYQFALPHDTRPKVAQEWEKLFLHDYQLGRAVYEPRSRENTRGNVIWMRMQRDYEARMAHAQQFATPNKQ
eukprot:PhM_4_TR18785/c1_g2_i9/m.21536